MKERDKQTGRYIEKLLEREKKVEDNI